MATIEQMQAAHDLRLQQCPSVTEEMIRSGWDVVHAIVCRSSPFVVTIQEDTRGWGDDDDSTTVVTNEIIRWSEAQFGPMCLNKTLHSDTSYQWQVGGWVWFYENGHDVSFYFIDATDAFAFKMRWG